MSFCKYKDIAGKPREGIHAARIPGIDVAAYDTFGTLIIAYLISIYMGYNPWKFIGGVLIAGIVAHRVFCVRTKVDEFLFRDY
jgi:hypothetical protein